jgi:hypothetical protein
MFLKRKGHEESIHVQICYEAKNEYISVIVGMFRVKININDNVIVLIDYMNIAFSSIIDTYEKLDAIEKLDVISQQDDIS